VSVAPTEPSKPQTWETLLDSPGVSVLDFRCRAHVEPLGPEEPNPTHSIVFVRRGVFLRNSQGEALVADANHVLFFNAGETYRYSHPLPGGDACTILAVDGQRALELVELGAACQTAGRRDEQVRRDLTGERAVDEIDWPPLTGTSEGAWREAVNRLRAGQRALREAVPKLPEARLYENVAGKAHSHWYELLGVLHHDGYHTGQISLLKKGRDDPDGRTWKLQGEFQARRMR
jgi:hypothetical protein